ncbi:hypothetical protein OTK49_02515 [Vibrio coralliirubri]|uniref:hypothetical protein n=1 Tax=Vibrio coralliirubri TaxID=1516159 RepID=UPI00228463D4|nr:hypothetical protein [Vibrio coralliirubri]MCY9861390.1 hypothetical protein [Vibrio coralliirubri]
MIIEHKETIYQHNVLIKTDDGELIAIASSRGSFFSDYKRDRNWSVLTPKRNHICHIVNPSASADTSLEAIVQSVSEKIDEIRATDQRLHVVQIKSEFGLTLYYHEDREFGTKEKAISHLPLATTMSLEKATIIVKSIEVGTLAPELHYSGDSIAEVGICTLDTNLIGEMSRCQ